VPRARALELAAGPGEASACVGERVSAARELLAVAPLPRTPDADALLSRAVERLPLSGRGRARVARVARTIAALAGSEQVQAEHLADALEVPLAKLVARCNAGTSSDMSPKLPRSFRCYVSRRGGSTDLTGGPTGRRAFRAWGVTRTWRVRSGSSGLRPRPLLVGVVVEVGARWRDREPIDSDAAVADRK
jgi:hypothetical protein